MKIKLFTIPNIITLSNLMCGVIAIFEVIANKNYTLAFGLIILAAVFDFFDGFVARLLKQQSPIGVELDSLADLISFGLEPAMILFALSGELDSLTGYEWLDNSCHYLTLVVVAFSALRLAKFNIDDTQQTEFSGLPTPANALFCASLGMIYQQQGLALPTEVLALIAVVMSLFMIVPLRMFALKFKGYGWHGNEVRYLFIALTIAIFTQGGLYALPVVIVSYILISLMLCVVARLRA